MKRILFLCCFTIIFVQAFSQTEPLIIDLSEETVYKVVGEMPMFPGCEDLESNKREQSLCGREKMTAYLYKHIKYPTQAKAQQLEGTCVIQFVVLKDGRIANPKIVRGISEDIDQHAIELVSSMNDLEKPWTPGKKDGLAENVYLTVPIRFKLDQTTNWDKAVRKGG